jgi:DNA-binding MarR family transcriptional regulator
MLLISVATIREVPTVPRRPPPEGLPPEPRVEIANRLNSAAIHLLRRISRDDGVDGVTGARLSALSVLVYGGPMSAGSLARRERIAPPTAVRIVEALVRDGYVERHAVPGDRRRTDLAATPAGRALMERGRARRIERLARDLEPLGAAELAALERALDLLEGVERTAEVSP